MASIADILIAKGNAAAAGTLQRGNIYADLIRNLSSVPGQAMQQQRALEQDQLKQQIQQQQLQVGQQELDTGRAAAEARKRNTDIMGIIGATPRLPNGDVDEDAVAKAAATHDPTLEPYSRTMAQMLNTSTADYRRKSAEAQNVVDDANGEFGLQLLHKPDMGNLQVILGQQVKNKWMTPEEATQKLTQAHDGGEQAIREIAQQMILRSKAARDATAAKVVMQKPDEVPLIQQPTPGGGVTLTPAPGIPVTKKPPTKEEDDIAMRNLRAKKIAADAGRGPSLTAAEDDQLAAYDQGKNVTTSTQDEELDAYAKLIGKPNRQALTYQDRQTFARNAAKIRADADFQQHIAQRNYDIKNPLHDPNDTLVKVEHQDANGRTVVEYLPRSDVKGKTFDKPVSAALANRLASAKAVNQTGDDIIAKLSDPAIAATVGPVMGRFNTLRDFLGNPPPELAELAGAIESYSLANMGVHGMRSAEGAAKINQMLNEKGTPASLIAKIKGLQQFSAHLLENEGRTVPTVPTATTPTTAPVVTNPFRR